MEPMERIRVGGLSIAYERAGTGAPLVLLHGGLSDHRDWRHQIDALSDTSTVVAWELPAAEGRTIPRSTTACRTTPPVWPT
jgi:pimeloyl-ACP methyl ester carboxylesterase